MGCAQSKQLQQAAAQPSAFSEQPTPRGPAVTEAQIKLEAAVAAADDEQGGDCIPAAAGPPPPPCAPVRYVGSASDLIVAAEKEGADVLTALPDGSRRLKASRSRESMLTSFHRRELAAEKLKKQLATDWLPEYMPASLLHCGRIEECVLQKTTRISQQMLLQDVPCSRKTKIVCTLGPACWSEEGLGGLIDAGMNVARFNFSHGSHADHQQVFDRFLKVVQAKGAPVASMLDTKGPEIRTAMLREGKDILLEEGQSIRVVAVGDAYTSWEGFKVAATGETCIGLSYAQLCSSVSAGSIILLGDGAISIKVEAVLSDTELEGTVLNSAKLGQRKNCNLPGVHVDLPVLSRKDVEDVQAFACKNSMEFIAASFVQCVEDVRYIRKVLDEAGGQHIKVISKIESQAGLRNYDAILAESDGIMVARGDLAMEIPSEKVALAQKMMITKANIAGKFIITATQMLESMVSNPLPTRAEMTDVANAVFDGTDAVMLSGETANGHFPAAAVATMAAITKQAELGVDYQAGFNFIRQNNAGRQPISPAEATLSGVAKAAVDFSLDRNGDGIIDLSEGCVAIVVSATGAAASAVAKYRPPCPVIMASSCDRVLKQAGIRFGLHPLKVPDVDDVDAVVTLAKRHVLDQGLGFVDCQAILVTGTGKGSADESPEITCESVGRRVTKVVQAIDTTYRSPFVGNCMVCSQTLKLSHKLITQAMFNHRSTKVIATIGHACCKKEQMAELLRQGASVVRFDQGTTPDLGQMQCWFDDFKAAAAAAADAAPSGIYTPTFGTMLSLRGPELRTSHLQGHKALSLAEGQAVLLVPLDDDGCTAAAAGVMGSAGSGSGSGSGSQFKGYRDEAGTAVVGVQFADLAKVVAPGQIILLAEGSIRVQVTAVTQQGTVQAVALDGNTLPECSLVHIPGITLDIPLLSASALAGLKWAAANNCDQVAVPFVQRAEDVARVRQLLDESGGNEVQVIAQVDTAEGVRNFDGILEAADGILICRDALGLTAIPPEKVCLAQKWMIAKCLLSSKPVFVAHQLLHSMRTNPRPTRAEMTDVANAVFDGADAIILTHETQDGHFPAEAVATAAHIASEAEVGVDTAARFRAVHNCTPKPTSSCEAICSSAVKAAGDMGASLIAVVSNSLHPVRLAAKYRPACAIVAVTTDKKLAKQANSIYGVVPMFVEAAASDDLRAVQQQVVAFARELRLAEFTAGDMEGDQLVLLSGPAHRLFATEEDLSEMQYTAVLAADRSLQGAARPAGDEAAELQLPTGHRGEDTISYRSTRVGLDLVCDPIHNPRKTKIVCTLGPACWSEEGLGGLIDAGMNVARFNFSHGSHADHQAVLDKLRAAAAAQSSHVAAMLDTKGPEIRTAMLRGGKPIELVEGQSIRVVAVGDAYTSWEGFKVAATGETCISLSYAQLCQDVAPGGRILIADGSVAIQVTKILSATELEGTVLNTNTLGERKNCNLPGVHVDLPVLSRKDVEDVQAFACKNSMEFIAASFVQCVEDVRYIRKVLDEAGGQHIKVISKIESQAGLRNYDAILAESDGIMVARGDLAMEIPSEKVALAQKMMITKANIAGKFIITATQMLESMVSNPLPTRAEMTDVANAVFDGTDAVMLSGETANGHFPAAAVATMAAIVANAEVGTNYSQAFSFIREFTDKPMHTLEAVVGAAAKDALDVAAGLIIVVTATGRAAAAVCKYRPCVPVLVVTDSASVARACGPLFAAHPYVVDSLPLARDDLQFQQLMEAATLHAIELGLCTFGAEIVVIHGQLTADADSVPTTCIKVAPGHSALPYASSNKSPHKTLSLRTTAISMSDIMDFTTPPRKTKIVCTLGPACWSEEGLGGLIDAGMNVARFNFSHGSHADHQQVFDRVRSVVAAKGARLATMLDTKGPEIRTAMLRDGADIEVQEGQELTLVAVGAAYETWEGFKDEATGETRIGISYNKLCDSVALGSRILVADGSLALQVLEVAGSSQVRCRALNAKTLGQRKNVNLPGAKIDIPVLTPKDVSDLKRFCVPNRMDFVAASFVQTAADIVFIRQTLDEAGGQHIKIIAKIENEAGLVHFDSILAVADGIMVARGDLAMEIPSEKVALAQKMMITKANIAGKFIITATQMLESMVSNPLPTRAEMTDVANAVFDGTDAVMLSGETANGHFPAAAVATMAAIVANAENSNSYYSTALFINDHSMKPLSRLEALCSCAAGAVIDCNAAIIITITRNGRAARMVSKYRPGVPQLVVTDVAATATQANIAFGQMAVLVEPSVLVAAAPSLNGPPATDSSDAPTAGEAAAALDDCYRGRCKINWQQLQPLVDAAKAAALAAGLWDGNGLGLLLHGATEVWGDEQPVLKAFVLAGPGSQQLLSPASSLPAPDGKRRFSLAA